MRYPRSGPMSLQTEKVGLQAYRSESISLQTGKRSLQARRKDPLFLQRVKKKFAGTEEGSTVPAKSGKEVCGHGGRIHCSCKEWKRSLRAQRKDPLFLQRVEKKFAGT
ncbi:hypothetical protein QA612_10835 [Evansella sp. AB-P1]|uniref:hypothetical protein n=1 Tax=Evansella sp. AB-P1 TaxID=3037653 RepID=UPI00241CC4D7|nr:hypothetical protein [Evansella sp. AB-P1]MDG5787984.1 hypothetical protein [Evansella sp. AB-P1]